MEQARRDGTAIPLEMPGVRVPLLDRAWLGQDKHIRWKPSGIPLSGEEVWRDRRMGEEPMRVTIVGAILIVVAFIAAVLLIRALAEKQDGGSDPKQPDHGTES